MFLEALRGIGSFIGNAWKKLISFFRREKKLNVNFTPELEAVATQLIQETIGTGGALEREFQRQIDFFRRRNQPIGEPQARKIIESLLKVAISQREQLNGRLEQHVEVGALYNRYYSKLQVVYDLSVAADSARKGMEEANNDYKKACKLYDFVYDSTLSPEARKFMEKGDETT